MIMDEQVISANKIGIVTICLNVFLCLCKFSAAYKTSSLSILSDAFNNLSDIGNALLILIGYYFTNKPADEKHPYGHGRFEYMMSQAVSLMIISVGFNLLTSSIRRILHPEPVIREPATIPILILAILIKLFMAFYFDRNYKKTKMSTMEVQKLDSLSDVGQTIVVLLAYVFSSMTTLPIDAVIGLCLSFFIIFNGIKILVKNTSTLLGEKVDDEVYDQIRKILDRAEGIEGYHDLLLHSYGHKIYGSCDVEIDEKLSLKKAHDALEIIELQIRDEAGVGLSLHPDPHTKNKKILKYKEKLQEYLSSLNIAFHDFHYNDELKMYFLDIVIPYDRKDDESEIKDKIKEILDDQAVRVETDRN